MINHICELTWRMILAAMYRIKEIAITPSKAINILFFRLNRNFFDCAHHSEGHSSFEFISVVDIWFIIYLLSSHSFTLNSQLTAPNIWGLGRKLVTASHQQREGHEFKPLPKPPNFFSLNRYFSLIALYIIARIILHLRESIITVLLWIT